MTTGDSFMARPTAGRPYAALVRQIVRGRQFALTVAAVGIFAFFSIFAENFFSSSNIYDIARVAAIMAIPSVALTFVFIAGEIDLSVGSLYGLLAVLMGIGVVDFGLDPWASAAAVVAAGAILGAVNGFAISVVEVPSFIMTLGTYSLFRGVALVLTGGLPIIYPDEVRSSFFAATNGSVAGVPAQVIWGIAIIVIGALVLKWTRFGAHVYATGGNLRSARAAGINTRRVKFACFVMTGTACGVIAAIQSGWLREGSPLTGSGFELQVIAAVIIGGVALTGGQGSVYGTVVGTWIIAMLPNGLTLLGVQGNWNQVFIGLIIVLVAGAELAMQRKQDMRGWVRRRRAAHGLKRGAGSES